MKTKQKHVRVAAGAGTAPKITQRQIDRVWMSYLKAMRDAAPDATTPVKDYLTEADQQRLLRAAALKVAGGDEQLQAALVRAVVGMGRPGH